MELASWEQWDQFCRIGVLLLQLVGKPPRSDRRKQALVEKARGGIYRSSAFIADRVPARVKVPQQFWMFDADTCWPRSTASSKTSVRCGAAKQQRGIEMIPCRDVAQLRVSGRVGQTMALPPTKMASKGHAIGHHERVHRYSLHAGARARQAQSADFNATSCWRESLRQSPRPRR